MSPAPKGPVEEDGGPPDPLRGPVWWQWVVIDWLIEQHPAGFLGAVPYMAEPNRLWPLVRGKAALPDPPVAKAGRHPYTDAFDARRQRIGTAQRVQRHGWRGIADLYGAARHAAAPATADAIRFWNGTVHPDPVSLPRRDAPETSVVVLNGDDLPPEMAGTPLRQVLARWHRTLIVPAQPLGTPLPR